MATKNAVQKKEQQSISIVQEGNWTEDQLKLITNTVAKGATTTELQLFLHQCQRTGLDPLSRQIHFVKRGPQATIQTGIDGLRLIADRTGRYAPGEPAQFQYDKNGKVVSAKISINKLVGDRWFPVWGEAFFAEYAQKTGGGQLTHMWRDKPHIMLGKCAEAIALRRGFPAELSGIYSHDEMAQADNAPMDAAPAKPSPQKRATKQAPIKVEATPVDGPPESKTNEERCRDGLIYMGVPENQLDMAFDQFLQQAEGDINQLLTWLRTWAGESYKWDDKKMALIPPTEKKETS